jgi:hypothetical protein
MNGLENMLDWLYDRTWLVTILTLVLVFLPLWYVFSERAKRSGKWRLIISPLLFSPLVLMWAPMLAGSYGYANEPRQMMVCGNDLCFLDHYETGDAAMDVYRLYVVDRATGEKRYRIYTGSRSELNGTDRAAVLYSNSGEFYLFDPGKNERTRTYGPSTLPGLYKECSIGVSSVKLVPYDNPTTSAGLLRIELKNGKLLFLEPFSGQIRGDANDNYITGFPGTGFSGNMAGDLRLEQERSNPRLKLLQQKTGDRLLDDPEKKEFLEGEIIGVSGNTVIIKSFATTDLTDFLITAVDKSMKMKWRHSQAELDGNDGLEGAVFGSSAVSDGMMYFNSGRYYYAVDVNTGMVKWKSRL